MAITYLKRGRSDSARAEDDRQTRETVEAALADIAARGDAAVRDMAAKFDGYTPESFRLSPEQIQELIATLSPSTVSAVLNGSWKPRRISEKTTQIIRSLALDLDYSANRQAKGLRNAKSGVIGLCCRSMTTASSRTWRRSSRPRRGRTG